MSRVGPQNTPLRGILVAGIVVVLVVAGSAVWYEFDLRRTAPGNSGNELADGPTFAQAYSAVNGTVNGLPGGPWILSQAFGIASPVPSSPSSWGWPGTYPETMFACGTAFNGLTIWNGSLPLFNGTFNSGTAPFWQFVFFSNLSGQLLVGTDVDQKVTVYPGIGLSSPCAEYSRLNYKPWVSAKQISDGLFPPDTPAMASASWGAVAEKWVHGLGTEPTEMYQFGDLPFGSGGLASTQLQFFTCGALGGVGATPGLSVFTNPDDPADVTSWTNYTLGCTPTADNWTPVPIHVEFNNSAEISRGDATYYAEENEILTGYNTSNFTNQTLGVTSWMVNLSLTSPTKGPMVLGDGMCDNWTATYTDCPPDSSGWYAVLLSESGQWLDSYGMTAHQGAWTLPAVPIVSGQYLVVVAPDTWNLTNATLTVSSTTVGLPMSGSYVIP
jgi:hypothetical protein